ncbi:MAG TPA: hypothetical protein VH740_18670 [Vicinamibacterales bacterium]|jgi:hypothetical protein
MPDDTAQRSWHFKRLRWSLQSLAAAGSDQPTLFPEHMMRADDLALDFDHWASFVRGTYERELSASQLDALAAIDGKLSIMSRDGREFDLDLWTDTALRTSEEWADVRSLALGALDAFGWPADAAVAR